MRSSLCVLALFVAFPLASRADWSTTHGVIRCSRELKKHDVYTWNHSRRVAIYSRAIAEGLGLSRSVVAQIAMAGQLHDLGKEDVSAAVIHKPDVLSASEKQLMNQHPRRGARRVRQELKASGVKRSTLRLIADGVLTHHESFDGQGYPRKLSSTHIPLVGRIIAVADTFDAMTSRRSYQRTLSLDDAVSRLQGIAGTRLDPTITAVFVQALRRNARVQAARQDAARDASGL